MIQGWIKRFFKRYANLMSCKLINFHLCAYAFLLWLTQGLRKLGSILWIKLQKDWLHGSTKLYQLQEGCAKLIWYLCLSLCLLCIFSKCLRVWLKKKEFAKKFPLGQRDENVRKIQWVRWRKICWPRNHEGLKDLGSFNETLLGKGRWNFILSRGILTGGSVKF